MSVFDQIPMSSDKLIEELDEAIPRAVINGPGIDDKDLQELVFAAGQRDIVDRLKHAFKRQMKENNQRGK